ncbi:MAG: hypothetical protein IT223_00890 [Crocinitomicaceae bacterium]|nr:hypothetical protein [Crocinitomicaceae bacterium]
MSWQHFREKVNLFLFRNKPVVLKIFKGTNIAVNLIALSSVLWMYGFRLSPEEEQLAIRIIRFSFGFYIIHYFIRFIYDFNPIGFIKSTWFEGLMIFILLFEGISHTFYDTLWIGKIFENFGFTGYTGISRVIIQVYFLMVFVIEFVRNNEFFPRIRLNPAFIFVLSFICIILGGALLLMLPEMTVRPGSMPFVDALFTSTSATCVTGLMTVDTHTALTFKGQFVILCLIKLGGTNIIAFGGFLSLVSKIGVGVKQHKVIEGFVAKDNILSASGMLGKVILWTTSIELLGATALYFLWSPGVSWYDTGERVFYSVFHAVSAFNNAGISLFQDGLFNESVRFNYLAHWVIILEIFFGALGILAIFDLFEPSKLRDRLKHPWKQIQFSTKIALYVSLMLIVSGACIFFFLEKDGVLAGQSLFGKITGAVFQTVTPRTAGFNTVNISMMGVPAAILTIGLMYVGASSTSTGGGIKTSTLAIIWSDIRTVMLGRERAVLWKRTIGHNLKSSAYSIAVIYIVMIFLGTFLLSITEKAILQMPGRSLLDLIFEIVSAYCTVGSTLGITGLLTVVGKYIVIAWMFIGRVGTFTIAFALAGKFSKENFKYPEAECMVG